MSWIKASCLILVIYANALQASLSEATAHEPIHYDMTITESKPYKLARTITGTITIAADNVTLDLNQHTISGETHGIVVNTGLTNIPIKNGNIAIPTSGNGIEIGASCTNIDIDGIRADQCAIGINITGSSKTTIRNCRLTRNSDTGIKLTSCDDSEISYCSGRGNNIGYKLDTTNKTHVSNCVAASNTTIGFSLLTTTNVIIDTCKALNTGSTSTGDSFGFVAENGSKNLFIKCVAEGATTTATAESNIVAGFALKGTETSSAIIECVARNIESSSSGQTIPYGIIAKTSLQTPVSKSTMTWSAEVKDLVWSPTGTQLAVGGVATSGREFSTYSFNQPKTTLLELANFLRNSTNDVYSLSWNILNSYIALGLKQSASTDSIVICSVDTKTGELALASSITPTSGSAKTINSVSWAQGGRLLIASGESMASKSIFVYYFNPSTQTLTFRGSVNANSQVYEVACSPNSDFVVAAGTTSTGTELRLYEYNPKNLLTLRDSKAHGATLYTTAWSPDGTYVAVGGEPGTGSYDTRIYEFDATAKTLTLRDSKTHGIRVNDVQWSPDGKSLITGGDTFTGNNVRIYSFSRTTKTLALQYSISHGAMVRAVAWSPNGIYAALGGVETGSVTHRIYQVATSPTNCIIRNNTLHSIKGSVGKLGVGISVPSITNLVVKNIAYNNDRNYEFNTRVSNSVTAESLLNYEN